MSKGVSVRGVSVQGVYLLGLIVRGVHVWGGGGYVLEPSGKVHVSIIFDQI